MMCGPEVLAFTITVSALPAEALSAPPRQLFSTLEHCVNT